MTTSFEQHTSSIGVESDYKFPKPPTNWNYNKHQTIIAHQMTQLFKYMLSITATMRPNQPLNYYDLRAESANPHLQQSSKFVLDLANGWPPSKQILTCFLMKLTICSAELISPWKKIAFL